MVLTYYRVPTVNQTVSYQCGIVNTLGGPCFVSCGYCITTIGNTMNMSRVLNNYQQIIRNFNRSSFRAFSVKPVGRISVRDIKKNINQKNPVIVGISPSGMGAVYPPGMSEHVALIIGYREQANNLWLKINDPMPYLSFGFDPYLRAGGKIDSNGSHWITYQQLVNHLGYKDTILVSRLD